MKELTEPLECELYSIYTDDDGKRYIHICAYIWQNEENKKKWTMTEGTFLIVPLEEFIEGVKDDDDGEYVDTLWCETKQYQIDNLSGKNIVENLNGYFNGKPADAVLHYQDITTSTPDGNYIH